MNVDQAREEWQAAGDYESACRLIRAQSACIAQLERELAEVRNKVDELENQLSSRDYTIESRETQLAAERALADDLDGGLGVAQDIIEAASKQLTKKAGTKWGLWYLDRISELRAEYRKARGL